MKGYIDADFHRSGGIANIGTIEGHINDLPFNSRLARFMALGKLEYMATALTPEAFTLSWTKDMSINFIGIAARTMKWQQ